MKTPSFQAISCRFNAPKRTTVTVIDHESDLSDELRRSIVGVDVVRMEPGDRAVVKLYKQQPDIVVISHTVGSSEVTQLSRKIRTDPRLPVTRVVVVASDRSARDARSIASAAHEVVVGSALSQCLARLLGQAPDDAPNEVIRVGAITVAAESYSVTVGKSTTHLTAGEYRLLWALASNSGRVLSLTQLAKLGGKMLDPPAARTIRARVVALRRKLGVAANQIENVRGSGYRLVS